MEKESVLICLYAYFPFENANTNVMLPLIRELSKKYRVHILTENCSGSMPACEEREGIVIHRYFKNGTFRRLINSFADIDKKKKRVWYKSLVINTLTPIARVLQKKVKPNEYIELKSLLQSNTFSFVITTCESFASHRNMLRLKKDTKMDTTWIAYFMDYIENRDTAGELLETERQVYSEADLILVTEEIYKENHENAFSPFLYKTVPIKFANFRCIHHELTNNIFIPGKINCVYVGSLLNERIRSPEYLYRKINKLDDRFHIHIICNRITKANEYLYEKTVENKDIVTWYHNLPLSECLGIMSHADILINLGNKSVNQTPSKVFDYIGTGKPIVNLYSLLDDTSKRYLERYPNKLQQFRM